MDSLEQFTQKLLQEYEDESAMSLTPDTKLRETGFWTSMHALITLAFVNTEYGVTLTGEELKNAQTIQDIYRLTAAKV